MRIKTYFYLVHVVALIMIAVTLYVNPNMLEARQDRTRDHRTSL